MKERILDYVDGPNGLISVLIKERGLGMGE